MAKHGPGGGQDGTLYLLRLVDQAISEAKEDSSEIKQFYQQKRSKKLKTSKTVMLFDNIISYQQHCVSGTLSALITYLQNYSSIFEAFTSNPSAVKSRTGHTWNRSNICALLQNTQTIMKEIEENYDLAKENESGKRTKHMIERFEKIEWYSRQHFKSRLSKALQKLIGDITAMPGQTALPGYSRPPRGSSSEKKSSYPPSHDASPSVVSIEAYNKLKSKYEECKSMEASKQEEFKQLEHRCKVEMTRLRDEKAELTNKLSQAMHDKISSNELHLENISIRNRPMNIACDYQGLTSNEWMHAMEELDRLKDIPNKDKHEFLKLILTFSADIAVEQLSRCINQPISNPDQYKVAKDTNPNEKVPNAVMNAIGDFWRGTADKMDKSLLIKLTKQAIQDASKPDPLKTLTKWFFDKERKQVNAYLRTSVDVAWKMALQRPPMKYKEPGANQMHDPNTQDVYFQSDNPNKYPVYYSVYPALYHGDTLMAKAKVVCKKTK